MRFCVPIPCFFKNCSFEEAIKQISSLGFDAAETYAHPTLPPEEVRRICDGYGVELLSMCTTDFRLTDAQHRGEWLDGMKRSAELAACMGVRRLITQSGPDTGEERARQLDNMCTTLALAAPTLASCGVTMMVEPLNTIVDHKGCFLARSDEAFALVRDVDSPFVRVIYDIYHQQITEGNIIPTVKENLPMIAHLHCAGHPGRHELQTGELDYKNIFAAIDGMGYTGACGIEYGPTMEPVESLRAFRRIYLGEENE